jgi:hypothetical protein
MTLPDVSFSEEPHILNLDDVKELQFMLAHVDMMEEARRKSTRRIKVLCLSIWYPLSMSRYFERAMRRNPAYDLKTVGAYTGSWIPWTDAEHPDGMSMPEKYAKSPDLPLPFPPNTQRVNYEFVKAQLGDWTPDIVIAIDAGVNWTHKPQDGYVVTIATDPHVLPYDHQRKISDKFFNMQLCYKEEKDVYLPYAYDPTVHRPVHIEGLEDGTWKDLDAVLIGNIYQERVQWVSELRKHGVNIEHKLGVIFDEARELANRALIGLNWSSLNDLNARFFETPAFGLAMVANRVPDAHLFLKEDEDYLAFTGLDEAIEKVLYLKKYPSEIERIAYNGYQKIQGETYDARVSQVLQECGF